jgi:hypothetical protein
MRKLIGSLHFKGCHNVLILLILKSIINLGSVMLCANSDDIEYTWKVKIGMQYFYKLYESLNGSMGTWEKSVVVKHGGKGIIVDSEKQLYKWICMAIML